MLLVEAVQGVGQRGDEQPVGSEVIQGAAQERHPTGRASQQLERLHRHEHKREPALEGERPPVGDDGLHRQASGAVLQRLQQRRVGVQRDDRDAPSGQVERDATGARPDVEHGAAGDAGQRPPQRKVLAVAAALEVVPEHIRRGHGHVAKIAAGAPALRHPDRMTRTSEAGAGIAA